jgi:hypothetical protein
MLVKIIIEMLLAMSTIPRGDKMWQIRPVPLVIYLPLTIPPPVFLASNINY